MSDPEREAMAEPTEGMSRRALMGRGAAVCVGIAASGAVGTILGPDLSFAKAGSRAPHGKTPPGYGPLIDDPAGRLALPRGFSYTVVAKSGTTTLETGEKTPDRPDGTANFERRGGGYVLVNNHEIGASSTNPVPHRDGLVYDEGAFGGTTTIEVDRHGNRIREYVSLGGTVSNCAGGRTPWHTWLTCEETEDIPGGSSPYKQRHGYVFEVDPYDNHRNQNPVPIKALGRYAHEAVVVDSKRSRLYLTEDAGNPNGLLYRYTPPHAAMPLHRGSLQKLGATDGTLEAMRAFDYGTFVPDLSVAQVGTTYDVEWVEVPDRDASTRSTRKQFNWSGGAGPAGDITRSRKLEGMWWDDKHKGAVFVASFARFSDGSAAEHDGQVWFLDPHEQTITLMLQFPYTKNDQNNDPDGPDNITVSPFGGVIVAEDGDGQQHLVGADQRGKWFFLARNQLSEEEFTGPNFSWDEKYLFANIQVPGHVFAITGPWRHGHDKHGHDKHEHKHGHRH